MKNSRDFYFDFSPYKNIAIFPHVNPDGDAIGSAVGLCHFLREEGKTANVISAKDIEYKIRFLMDKLPFVSPEEAEEIKEDWDLIVVVDCGDIKRIEDRAHLIEDRPIVVIDHHKTNGGFGDYNFIYPNMPATCEIIYNMIEAYGGTLSPIAAEALYTGLLTDTGSYQYSNANAQTLRVGAELLDTGMDKSEVIFHLYQNEKPQLIKLETMALSKAEYYFGGRLALTCVDAAMLSETGAEMSDSGEISSKLRNIAGVVVACLLKEEADEHAGTLTTKVSARALKGYDLTKIASFFGGGGHIAAAGFTIKADKEEAKARVLKAFEDLGYFDVQY